MAQFNPARRAARARARAEAKPGPDPRYHRRTGQKGAPANTAVRLAVCSQCGRPGLVDTAGVCAPGFALADHAALRRYAGEAHADLRREAAARVAACQRIAAHREGGGG